MIKLVKFEDESRNIFASGYLFADLSKTKIVRDDKNNKVTHVVMVPISCEKNKFTELVLKVFCKSLQPLGGDSKSNLFELYRVFSKIISVPKFAMFALAKSPHNYLKDSSHADDRIIRMEYRLKDYKSKTTQVSVVIS